MQVHTIVRTRETPSEPQLRSWQPWQAVLLAVLASMIGLLLLFTPGIVARRVAHGALTLPIVTGALGAGVAVLVVATVPRLFQISPRVFFIRTPDLQTMRWAGVTCLLVGILVAWAIVTAPAPPRVGPRTLDAVLLRICAALAVGLWTGIVEELIFRGVLLSVIGHQWHWPGAIVITALLFGLLHQGAGTTWISTAQYVFLTTVAGLLMGTIVVITGNVWNAIAIHATWNAAFSASMVRFNPTADPVPLVSIPSDPGVLLGAGAANPTESPLAIFLFLLVLVWYWGQLYQKEMT